MTQLIKRILCFNSSSGYVCNSFLGDMEVYAHSRNFYCKNCKITWRVEQTKDGNLKYKIIKRGAPIRQDYDDSGVVIIES